MHNKTIILLLAVGLMMGACGLAGEGSDDGQGRVGNEVSIYDDGTFRYVASNGIPDHAVGDFPNEENPHEILVQSYLFQMALNPSFLADAVEGGLWPWGVSINGIPLDPQGPYYVAQDEFDPSDPFAGIESGWQYEALFGGTELGHDANNAHVQPGGGYHYHGMPTGLLDRRRGETTANHMVLMGYAADGFPVYGPNGYVDAADISSGLEELASSYRLKAGQRPLEDGKPSGAYDGTFVQDYEYVEGLGDLDDCNGRFGRTLEYPAGTYYYVLTWDFPFIPRCFHATPDDSFLSRGQ